MGNSENLDKTAPYLKMLLHFLQICSIIDKMGKFNIPPIVEFLPELMGKPINTMKFLLDCYYYKRDNNFPAIY